jgi:glucose-6-phosphate 1-dehydrogenase
MLRKLAILGGTGDLTARYLLPGLAALRAAGDLDGDLQLIAVGRHGWTDETFRSWATTQLDRHARGMSSTAKHAVVAGSRYHQGDVTDPSSMAAVVQGGEPLAAYLALPPSIFPRAVSTLHRAGTAPGSIVALEKPFGESLGEALALNRLLSSLYPEEAIFRVDHFLAMTTVQNILGMRLANRVLEPIWNSAHISGVDIVWDETLALEGRAGYYDGVGALKDMLQNHLLQVLCLVAMDPPISLGDRDLRDRKVDVLRSIRPLRPEEAAHRTCRARYTGGQIGERAVPAYTEETGVDAERRTETFAQVDIELDNRRWAGTVFRLRTGKALRRDRKEVAVHFRPVHHLSFEHRGQLRPNVLRFGLEPESVVLELTGTGPRTGTLVPLTLAAQLEPAELPPYGQLLLDILTGSSALSIRADEAEESWRVVAPVLDAWSRGLVPLEEYPAGSDGPRRPPSPCREESRGGAT